MTDIDHVKKLVEGMGVEDQFLVRTLRCLKPALGQDDLKAFFSDSLEHKLKTIFKEVKAFTYSSNDFKRRIEYYERRGHKPECFGKKGDDCMGCFYNRIDLLEYDEPCSWKTYRNQGHTEDCIQDLIYGGPCSCGVDNKGNAEKRAEIAADLESRKDNYLANGQSDQCAHDISYFGKPCSCGIDEAEKKMWLPSEEAKEVAYKACVERIQKQLHELLKDSKEVEDVDFAAIVCRILDQEGRLQSDKTFDDGVEKFTYEEDIKALLNKHDIALPGWDLVVSQSNEDKEDLACGLVYYLLDKRFGDIDSYDSCIGVDDDKYLMFRERVEASPRFRCWYDAALKDSAIGRSYHEVASPR